MPETQLTSCWLRCRPVMKVFVARRKRFRRSPDDKPFLLCLGSKAGGAVVLEKHATKREAVLAMRVVLDWLDGEEGQAAYQDALRAMAADPLAVRLAQER